MTYKCLTCGVPDATAQDHMFCPVLSRYTADLAWTMRWFDLPTYQWVAWQNQRVKEARP